MSSTGRGADTAEGEKTVERGQPRPGGEEAGVVAFQPRGVGLKGAGMFQPGIHDYTRDEIDCNYNQRLREVTFSYRILHVCPTSSWSSDPIRSLYQPFNGPRSADLRNVRTASIMPRNRHTDPYAEAVSQTARPDDEHRPDTPRDLRHSGDSVSSDVDKCTPASTGSRVAAFFDLDKTLISASSTLAFTRPFYEHGLLSRSAVLKAAFAQIAFALTAADHNQVEHLRRHITDMSLGWDAEQIRRIVSDNLTEVITPLLYDDALRLIADHKAQGHDVVLISASGIEMVEPIGAHLGVDHVAASRMRIVDGRYAGHLESYCYGEEKAHAMAALASAHDYDLARCHAYSDSVTDLPMLAAVGHPHVVNPDRGLRAAAIENGWPIIEFTQDRAVRKHLTHGAAPIAVGLTIGAAALGGAGIYVARARISAAG